ncbi:MAG TPA: sulfotransferase [Lacipirellulaceae bacterium]|jgi:LPS sulfotransferase NodH|nr:sulfotransferase [Lacipirellulaceae bacterium]
MSLPGTKPSHGSYTDKPLHRYPRWAMRFWHGMDFITFLRLLVRNHFAVPVIRWSMVATVSFTSLLNLFSGVFEWFLFSDRVRQVKLKEPPLFVLGHWRSGTTLLHELLMLDGRHTCPTTYQCLAPHHFLWTSWFIPALTSWFLPKQRPMDDMAAGWNRPQEDEFALVNLGVPSPYLVWAFPNHGPVYDEYLDLRTLNSSERETWKQKWRGFVQRVALANNRRIVLKSPTHTARVRTILEVFPDAKFIHIVRNPLVLYPSTVRLWKSLSEVQGFQIPHDDHGWIENSVLDNFVRMYECFEQDRDLIPPGRLVDIRYEELTVDPVGQMRQVYQQLNLGSFSQVEPELMRYAMKSRGYKPNKYQLPADVAERVRGRWAPYFQRYGYSGEDSAAAPAAVEIRKSAGGNAGS